jgi:hypothetical protein
VHNLQQPMPKDEARNQPKAFVRLMFKAIKVQVPLATDRQNCVPHIVPILTGALRNHRT